MPTDGVISAPEGKVLLPAILLGHQVVSLLVAGRSPHQIALVIYYHRSTCLVWHPVASRIEHDIGTIVAAGVSAHDVDAWGYDIRGVVSLRRIRAIFAIFEFLVIVKRSSITQDACEVLEKEADKERLW